MPFAVSLHQQHLSAWIIETFSTIYALLFID